ncbi:MAG: hypothetical protein MUF81_09205 [Verrucomicrobia bacterium]|nr:hypothetical protein [Verrucomicrobiota bacterium]
MTALQLRKQTLLLESDLNRLTLHVECAQLREATNWMGQIRGAQKRIPSWALAVAPLAGVALVLGLRRSSAGAGLLTKALGVAPSLIQIWRMFSASSNEPK